jgi:FkbM family methyltransferase
MLRNSSFMAHFLRIKPDLVIHVGADKGQNRNEYLKLGVNKIVWCEANPSNVKFLKKNYPKDLIISGIVSDKNSKRKNFYLMHNTSSGSAIAPSDETNVLKFRKIIKLKTLTLDSVFKPNSSSSILLTIDVQGLEERVLIGAKTTLSSVNYVIIEIALVSQGYVYAPTIESINSILFESGFKPSISRISHDESYKDQLFIRGSNTRIMWIKIVDNIFDYVMRFRHFLKKGHFPKYHYYCITCNK